jgi:MFS transporter, UMF1 family
MARLNKLEKSWVLYDWANSAYSIAITTALLPIFFKMMTRSAGIAASDSTAYWGYVNSAASIVMALLAPVLGTIADYRDYKKRLFSFFAGAGVFFTAAIAVVPDGNWKLLLAFYVLTALGFTGANIFYDAFLVDVADDSSMDSVSSKGYAYGYIGSTIPFIIGIAIVYLYKKIGITEAMAYQLAFVITALWWGLFTIPFLRNVRQKYYLPREPRPISSSFKRIYGTFRNIKNYRQAFIFLIAYFFYIDGVDTIIKMAGTYGDDMGIDSISLLIILLATQFVAFPFALLYGKLSEKFTGKKMIYVAIVMYIAICLYAYQLDTVIEFWILAMLVASSQGGIQALSRSYFGKLIPKENSNEFFGFYNISGKFAAIMGPAIMGIVTQLTGSSSYGVLSIAGLFIIGLVLLIKVPETAVAKS